MSKARPKNPPATAPATAPVKPVSDTMALVRRAEAGDRAALDELGPKLALPGLIDVLGGNLAEQATRALLDAFAKNQLLAREVTARKAAALKAELAGPDPSPVERLLAERAVVCWLHLYHLECVYGRKESMTLDLGMYYQKAISAAHKRYLSALRTLAEVRRLARPAVQVNIARKQVNVAGTVAP